MSVWVNHLVAPSVSSAVPCGPGWVIPSTEAAASAFDRGLLLGDGLFETVLVRRGGAPFLERHLGRLATGSRLLGFAPPPPLDEVISGFLAHQGIQEGIMRITYTRGRGPRGYRPPDVSEPFCFISIFPVIPPDSLSWRATVSDVPVVPHPILSRVKHTSALSRILALQEAEKKEAQESIVLTPTGLVVEGTATNVFWRSGGVLYTPDPDAVGCLPGVGRHWAMDEAKKQGLEVCQGGFPLADLLAAEEAFFTNAVRGPIPLTEVLGLRRWEGKGPVTHALMTAWARL